MSVQSEINRIKDAAFDIGYKVKDLLNLGSMPEHIDISSSYISAITKYTSAQDTKELDFGESHSIPYGYHEGGSVTVVSNLDNGTVDEFTAFTDSFPLIEEGEDMSTIMGKIAKFTTDAKDAVTGKSFACGVEVDFANNKFTRLGDAVGLSAGADFDKFAPWGGRRRCTLADNGTVTSYYGDSNYKEDGSKGQCMVEQPIFYCKLVKSSDTVYQYWVSDHKADNNYVECPGFKNSSGITRNLIYLSTYEGCLYDVSASAYITNDSQVADFSTDKLSSIANAKPMSGITQNLTRANTRKLATNRGGGWRQQTIWGIGIDKILFLVEYATFNSQTAIGQGVVNKTDDGSTNMSNNTGSTASLGNASGRQSGTDGLTSVTYRGRENLWGNIWIWTDGININEYQAYVKEYPPFTDDTTTGYTSTGFKNPTQTLGAYISRFGANTSYPTLLLPTANNGTSSAPVGDGYWSTTGWRVAVSDGSWKDALMAGLCCLTLINASSHRGRGIGGRLEYVEE